jgi:hypothetical protein
LAQLPPIEWDIEGVLPTGGLGYLVGAPGSGKTLLAIDWSCSIALGRPWYGRSVRQGPVLYIAAEGSRSLHTRLDCWKWHHRTLVTAESGVRWFDRRLVLTDHRQLGAFLAAVLADGLAPRWVMIDTLPRCTQGSKENDPDSMGQALAAADQIRETLQAGVLFITHPSREGELPRGHGSQEGAADSIWFLKVQDGVRTLTAPKLKDGDESQSFSLVLCPVGNSVLLLPSAEAEVQAPVQARLTSGQRAVLASIRGTDTGSGVTAATIIEASKVAKSSVHFVLKNLRDLDYVTEHKHRWSVTPLGLVQLSSEVSSAKSSGA